MNQIGFHDIFERPLVFPDRGRKRIETNRPTRELLDERRQEQSIEPIEPRIIHIEALEGEPRGVQPDTIRVAVPHGREVPNPAQESIGDSRRSSRASGDLVGRLRFDFHAKQTARSKHDLLEI